MNKLQQRLLELPVYCLLSAITFIVMLDVPGWRRRPRPAKKARAFETLNQRKT